MKQQLYQAVSIFSLWLLIPFDLFCSSSGLLPNGFYFMEQKKQCYCYICLLFPFFYRFVHSLSMDLKGNINIRQLRNQLPLVRLIRSSFVQPLQPQFEHPSGPSVTLLCEAGTTQTQFFPAFGSLPVFLHLEQH